ncbi:MAG TPA: DUF2079 domain-containing protein [Anaerolineae bacterium]|nr:DUF2079 domain-containing protein [Anaerolineae bacterium]
MSNLTISRERWFVGGYLVVVGILLYAGFHEWAYDDPFITYRYAQNVLRGNGFVYNTGLKVLSTTTPFFALILAIFGLIVPDLHYLANFLGIASIALGAYFIWDLSKTWQTPIVGWVVLLLYPSFPLLLTTLGSETLLYLALCLGAFATYAKKRYNLTALFSALAVLTRADGILVPFLLSMDFINRRLTHNAKPDSEDREERALPWSVLFIFLVILGLWFSFAWVYFGSPIPATLFAKQAQGNMAISQRFAPGILRVINWYMTRWQYWIEAILAVIGIFYALAAKRRWLLFFFWTILYFVSYTILGVSSYFWYYAPLVPGFVVAVGLGIQWLWNFIPQDRYSLILRGAMVVLVAAVFVAQVNHVDAVRINPDHRYKIYRATGEWLAENSSENATVGALEVGIIGYYANRPMIGFAGLIQPDVAKVMNKETTYEDTALWAIKHYHPDYLVLYPGVFPKVEESIVAVFCFKVASFNKNRYDSPANLFVYACDWNK